MIYSEKLRDPRWQKRRLEILQRDQWTCRLCQETRKPLHVHHERYLPGREPWEYSDDDLITFCDDCHDSVTTLNKDIKDQKAAILRAFEQLSFSEFMLFPVEKLTAEVLRQLAGSK